MSKEGFERMLTALKQYLKSLEMQSMMRQREEKNISPLKETVL